ncbi:hypothetical protein MTR67_013873 [Solanum verrucosum]|uniref:Uncharacterized protein n=1 Tax=Solanum verrucosum TaxID=315347 RepID=A0AAF0QC98_SOLVR|nr:hypothetical protein MTR67_013873 [Solanum verrucosum]
MEYTNCFHS